MHPYFEELTPAWFNRAYVYNGSIGPAFNDFRYRFAQDSKANVIRVAVYSKSCYETAKDVVEEEYEWSDEGVEKLKSWIQERYEAFLQGPVGGSSVAQN